MAGFTEELNYDCENEMKVTDSGDRTTSSLDIDILLKAKESDTVYKSLQTSSVEQNRAKLLGILSTLKGQIKSAKVEGLLAVLDSLTVPFDYDTKYTEAGKWKGYLPFDVAFDLYADKVYIRERMAVTPQYQKSMFREDLLHPEYGLCVYIFRHCGTEWIILQSDQVEYSGLLRKISATTKGIQLEQETSLSFEFVQGLLGTLDTEWSRLVVRGLLSSIMSGKQLYDVGIKPRVANASLERLNYVLEECQNSKLAAKDIVHLRIKEEIQHLSEKKLELQEALKNVFLSESNKKKIESQLSSIQERYQQKQEIQSKEDSVAFKTRLCRAAQSLVEENRLKCRQLGAGRPSVLDEDTVELVVSTLESESNAERRRRDSVMYCDRSRIKEADLLELANHYLVEQGKEKIKSSRTVALWQKPKKSNTREGQRHRQGSGGRFLFTCKKPEKTLEDTHIDTHHQRAHIKLVRTNAYEENSPVKSLTLDLSMDDKATLKTGTDVGWQGTKGRGVFMSTEKPLQFRGHDFVGSENQLTPSAFRVMKWTTTDLNGSPSLVRAYDQSFVTVRPKDKELLGSSGAVWASEQIRLVEEFPDAFCLPTSIPKELSTFLLRVQHNCFLYSFCTGTEDEDEEINLQSLISFEEERKIHLQDALSFALTELKDASSDIFQPHGADLASIMQATEDLLNKLRTCKIPEDVSAITNLCDDTCQKVKSFPGRPVPYPNVIELTDKGPGAGVHNIEVQDLFVLMCKLLESDHRIRIHRAPHDSAQNEAERTNAAIGEALATGKPVEPPMDPFNGITPEEMDNMSLKEINQRCQSWKTENTWKMVQEVSERIHDEHGPGKNNFLVSVASYPKEKQLLCFLAKYLLKWKRASEDKRATICGNALFSKLHRLKERHARHGQYYIEYLKFSCSPNSCDSCKSEGWTTGVPAEWYPVPEPSDSSAMKYASSTNTGDIDKFLPSVQIKKSFEEGNISSADKTTIDKTSSAYIVEENLCKNFVQHLEFLDAKSRKRAEERNSLPDICWTDEKSVEALTNKQLKMYLKQEHLKVGGNKKELVERILSHALGRPSENANPEEINMSSSAYETSSESEASESEQESSDESYASDSNFESGYIETSFEVLFIPDEDVLLRNG